MSYAATVLTVMIASPSDVKDDRDAVERAVYNWNDANAEKRGVILRPWRWETSAVPVLGDHPQRLINAQGVDKSDIVIAMFAGRLGSATPDAISGTAEEIEHALDSGKPVHLYFSIAQLPSDVDTAQLDALRAFRTDMESRGLLGEYSNASQLEHEVWKAIEHDINEIDPSVPSTDRTPQHRPAEFLVQPQQEREMSVDSKGKTKYTTRHWLDVTNTGSEDAHEVTFESVGKPTAMHLGGSADPTVIHAGQTRRLNTLYVMSGGQSILRIKWKDGDEEKTKDFHVD
ncbi:DUF4062 domain-containing protein [Curtobacterium sp. MCBD17_026]|uniref:DUF4062 domain-containing protein n=1 Tax=Curtobacterium sp. MCBD17_026 TaxID=2175621 RepID=UPI000DAA9F13|nr:DUF4062 domain-containing protein [Curtobacterium sp. MCBD17_026]WIB72538.1 DUF4062 domain-containing protein [Curtobacterium sp. MCBD17_026]